MQAQALLLLLQVFLAHAPGGQGLHMLSGSGVFPLGSPGLLIYIMRYLGIYLRAGNLLQQLRFLALLGREEIGKAVLCQYDGAGKLAVVQPYDLLYEALHLSILVSQDRMLGPQLLQFALHRAEFAITV